MESPALLECFACSRRTCWRPRPFRLMRPFQQIRCHPETAPPHLQCTYGDVQGGRIQHGAVTDKFIFLFIFMLAQLVYFYFK